MRYQRSKTISCLLAMGAVSLPLQADETLPDSGVIMRALSDEITRSMKLQLEDLEKPYFLRYTVDDSITYQISAAYGTITSFERDRSRKFYSQVRVGTYELDNTNFSDIGSGFFFGMFGRGGGGASLPLDDDYLGIRQAIWWATDQNYKDAVEKLTKKRAYMKDKNIDDRPDDFSKADPVQQSEPTAKLRFDPAAWKKNLKRITAAFRNYEDIQDSKTQLFVGAGNTYVVNSEGTRVRFAYYGAIMVVTAESQADDGMKVSNKLTYYGRSPADFPPVEKIIEDIGEMVSDLAKMSQAPLLDQYTGPVLFDGEAAGQMFRKMFADGIAGQVDPVGTQRRMFQGAKSLEKKLGKRILPVSFQVYDDPTVDKVGDRFLLGHFRFDEEGVAAKRVEIVKDGTLKTMVLSRVPTKKLSGSNGHGRRSPGQGTVKASIGCLFIVDKAGVPADELKAALIEAARNEDLEYGLRVTSLQTTGMGSSPADFFSLIMRMQRGGGEPSLGDPVAVFKVYVDDGREELIRGCEFGQVTVRSLKKMLAAGDTATVHNYINVGLGGATPPASIISPAVLFEELELSKIEQEHPKLPILKAPIARETS